MPAPASPMRGPAALGLVLAAVLLLPAIALAQTAELRGSVDDASGSALPGVTVTITNTATGVERVVITDEQGGFRAPALQPGPYSVASSLSGFSQDTKRLVLTVGQVADLKVALENRRHRRDRPGRRPLRDRDRDDQVGICRRWSASSSSRNCRCSTAASSAWRSCCRAGARRARRTAVSASRPRLAAPTCAACTRCRSTAASWITRSTVSPSSTSVRMPCRSSACSATSSTRSTRGPAPPWSTWSRARAPTTCRGACRTSAGTTRSTPRTRLPAPSRPSTPPASAPRPAARSCATRRSCSAPSNTTGRTRCASSPCRPPTRLPASSTASTTTAPGRSWDKPSSTTRPATGTRSARVTSTTTTTSSRTTSWPRTPRSTSRTSRPAGTGRWAARR